MGEVNKYHVMRTLSSVSSAMNMIGLKVNPESSSIALEKMRPWPSPAVFDYIYQT